RRKRCARGSLYFDCILQTVTGGNMKRLILLLATSLAMPSMPLFAASADCDRSRVCLARTLDTYLQALVAHDPSRLPMTRNIKYTENGVRLNIGDGLWATAAAAPTYRVDVVDEEEG